MNTRLTDKQLDAMRKNPMKGDPRFICVKLPELDSLLQEVREYRAMGAPEELATMKEEHKVQGKEIERIIAAIPTVCGGACAGEHEAGISPCEHYRGGWGCVVALGEVPPGYYEGYADMVAETETRKEKEQEAHEQH